MGCWRFGRGVRIFFCNRYRGFNVRLYFLCSLTPMRGGTYFFCCDKRSKQEKALHPTSAYVSAS
jgi:hypothetical protein